MNEELMRCTLLAGVPLEIDKIKRRGGPKDSDFEAARWFAQDLAEFGDILQFYERNRSYSLMADLIFAVSVMAFVPGGIEFLGVKWEVKP